MNSVNIDELIYKDLTNADLKTLLHYYQLLTAALGNGTMEGYKRDQIKCQEILKRLGDLNDLFQ